MTGHARRHSHNQREYQSRIHQHQRSTNHPSSLSSHNQNHSHHQSGQKSSSCSLTICYSYLIAIFSSFLVVLGLYLSITRFNARFLYLSLAGLLIEALGACLYCISNIHRSKLAQYKQAGNEFNIENNQIPSGSSAAQISGEQAILSRQQQAQAVTHILTHRTLNQSAISPDTSSTTNLNNSNNLANPINRSCTNGDDRAPNTRPTDIHDDSQRDNNADNQSIETSSSTGALLHRDVLMQQHRAENAIGNDNQLPTSDHETCQEQPQDSSTMTLTSQSHERNDEESSQPHDASLIDKDVSAQNNPANIAQDNQLKTHSSQNSDRQASAIDETDLINRNTIATVAVRPNEGPIIDGTIGGPEPEKRGSLLPALSQAEPSPSASSRIRSPRSSNLRRTLVMGLSGEEEMIEIDEEDLDNMSILPPPYESIATIDDANKHHQSQ